jgi:hypothetical protein
MNNIQKELQKSSLITNTFKNNEPHCKDDGPAMMFLFFGQDIAIQQRKKFIEEGFPRIVDSSFRTFDRKVIFSLNGDKELKQKKPMIKDFIQSHKEIYIYLSGHGDVWETSAERDHVFAISTRPASPGATSSSPASPGATSSSPPSSCEAIPTQFLEPKHLLKPKNFASPNIMQTKVLLQSVIFDHAQEKSVHLILDSCFAGELADNLDVPQLASFFTESKTVDNFNLSMMMDVFIARYILAGQPVPDFHLVQLNFFCFNIENLCNNSRPKSIFIQSRASKMMNVEKKLLEFWQRDDLESIKTSVSETLKKIPDSTTTICKKSEWIPKFSEVFDTILMMAQSEDPDAMLKSFSSDTYVHVQIVESVVDYLEESGYLLSSTASSQDASFVL